MRPIDGDKLKEVCRDAAERGAGTIAAYFLSVLAETLDKEPVLDVVTREQADEIQKEMERLAADDQGMTGSEAARYLLDKWQARTFAHSIGGAEDGRDQQI